MLTHHSPLLSAGPPEMAAFIAIIFSDYISISDPRDDSLSLCYFCCQPIPTHHPHAPWGQLSLSKPDILPWSIFQLLVLSSLCVSCHASLFPTWLACRIQWRKQCQHWPPRHLFKLLVWLLWWTGGRSISWVDRYFPCYQLSTQGSTSTSMGSSLKNNNSNNPLWQQVRTTDHSEP